MQRTIQELEDLFAKHRSDQASMSVLAEELSHRSTKRADKLRSAVSKHQAQAQPPIRPAVRPPPERGPLPASPPRPNQSPPPIPAKPPAQSQWDDDPRPPRPPSLPVASKGPVARTENAPDGVLSAWTALEVLSPPAYQRPEDLAGGDRNAVAILESGAPPWQRGEKSKPNYRMYYQVVLGSIPMEPAISRLLERYADGRAERPSIRGSAALAVVIVDKNGRLAEVQALAVSSFGWGLVTALDGTLSDLADWAGEERRLTDFLRESLLGIRADDQSEDDWSARPLTLKDVFRAYQALVRHLRLPTDLVEPPTFAIRSYVYFKDSNPPDAVLLNSFFMADLAQARVLFQGPTPPENLKRYLGALPPTWNADLLKEDDVLEDAVAPCYTPLARWPAQDRQPSLLQQAAVNLAFTETVESGVVGINGPPGTGKTTLLRDIVAAVVLERATAMVAFTDPEHAFVPSGEKMKAGDSWLHLYRVDESLRGFEMLVASSNNRAVENVSEELPQLNALPKHETLRYFKSISDAVHGIETWGLIAAVLGNSQNRARFKKRLWWDDEWSLNRYLAAASGLRPLVKVVWRQLDLRVGDN